MLRGRLVAHQGKRELAAHVMDLMVASFEYAVADFCAQIRSASDPVIHDTLICDFSTTTQAIRTASEIAIMDAYSSYFDYLVDCVCGIPKVTLEGTPEDWRRIPAGSKWDSRAETRRRRASIPPRRRCSRAGSTLFSRNSVALGVRPSREDRSSPLFVAATL